MNPVHLHLVLNHVSIMAALFSVIIFLYGFFRKNESARNIALVGFVLAALTAIPVFLTGEPAEEAVEHLAGVQESVIEQHEEAAELAIWLIGITGALALGGLLRNRIKLFAGPAFAAILLVASIASGISISYTGFLGGKIRHTELSAAQPGGATNEMPGGGEAGDDDDD